MAERSDRRVVLELSRATRACGWGLLALGAAALPAAHAIDPWWTIAPAAAVALGAVLATLQRRLVLDREAGTLVYEHRVAGLRRAERVPLFHLRAVVVAAQPGVRSRYVAFIERRVGEPIYLDEARRVARLMRMAEAVAEVAEVRLEYDAGA